MDMKQQRFGIKIELTEITRKSGAEIVIAYFGVQSCHERAHYGIYVALDPQGREWKFVSNASIKPERKEGKDRVAANDSYKTEMVNPICRYEDIETIQGLIRKLREAGALANSSCRIHVHIDASPLDVRTLRNITNIMAAEEGLIYEALQASVTRQNRWCESMEERFLEELNQKKPGTLEEARQIWYNGASRQREYYDNSRYHCLNLHSVFQKGTVEFRLFNRTTHADKIKTYVQLYLTIRVQVFNQTSASRRKTRTTDEGYTFRTQLLRLGLDGDEFRATRLCPLKHLDGCTAWKDLAQAEAQKEWLRMKWEKELQIQEERGVPTVELETNEQEENMHIETEVRSLASSMMTGV